MRSKTEVLYHQELTERCAQNMNQLSQIFLQTTGKASSSWGQTDVEDKKKEDDNDPLLDAFAPTDTVNLRSSSQFHSRQGNFTQMKPSGGFTMGLPSLSNSYNSNTGSLLDLKG